MIEVIKFNQRGVRAWDRRGYMIRVDKADAIRLIQSLAAQIDSESPNVGRTEFHTKDNQYFSVAVHDELPLEDPIPLNEREFQRRLRRTKR